MSETLTTSGAAALARSITSGEVSAREVVDAHRARIEADDERVNAVVTAARGGLAGVVALGDGGLSEAAIMLAVVLASNLALENFVEPKVMGRSPDVHPLVVPCRHRVGRPSSAASSGSCWLCPAT